MKEIYESPKTTLRKVVMESSCMAASNPAEKDSQMESVSFQTKQQDDGINYESFGGDWSLDR